MTMNLHEYQAKQLFAEYGLPVSEGIAAETVKEAVAAADVIGGDPVSYTHLTLPTILRV